MEESIVAQIKKLRDLKSAALRIRYREVFGEESRSANREFLFRRIAWRLQAQAEGDLSERARRRALELADDADLRIRVPKGVLLGEAGRTPALLAVMVQLSIYISSGALLLGGTGCIFPVCGAIAGGHDDVNLGCANAHVRARFPSRRPRASIMSKR